ncbi:MAG: hypothetical protein PF542_04805 [Nanoarchaeota archaeon]|jgi:nitrogen fixation protein|nr:hypothetical protein [Nanoarchaeota archaeon]
MKKIFAIFVIGVVLLAVTVFAQGAADDKAVENFVKDVASVKGVEKSTIKGVKELDLRDLPQKVNLNNIDETNLAIYEIDTDAEKPVYVVTASSKFFKETVRKFAQRMLLAYGFNGEIMETTFLKTATGVVTSLQKGYVMTRDGAISGLSTNLEIIEKTSSEPIEVVVYKNSEKVGFRNMFNLNEPGIYSDYDTISGGTIVFEKGDVISLEINIPENTRVRDVTSLLDIETE